MTIPEHVIEAAARELYQMWEGNLEWEGDSSLADEYRKDAMRVLSRAFASLWQPIESVKGDDFEPWLVWSEDWSVLQQPVVAQREGIHWFSDALDLDEPGNGPTLAARIPLPKGSE